MIITAPENLFYDLDEALAQPDRVEAFYLHDHQMEALPDALLHLPNLRALRLALPRLRRLPDEFPAVTELSLEGTSALDLDQAFVRLGALPSLNALGVYSVAASLPPSVGRLTQLDALAMDGGAPDPVPAAIGRLTGLTRLRLTSLSLSALPPELGDLASLRSLHIMGGVINGRPVTIERLPDSIGRLASLEELFLWHLPLTELPTTLGGLTALRRLTVAFAKFSTLPDSARELISLEELALRGPPIDVAQLVKVLAPLPRLRRLALECCSEVSLTRGLVSLESLSELLVPRCMNFSVEEGFAPPPQLALLSVPKWNLTAVTRDRLDAALPKKRWSGRNERDERIYRRKAPKAPRVP